MSNWKSIDELMAGRKPGEIELQSLCSRRFRPYYKIGSKWLGTADNLGGLLSACHSDDSKEWKIIKPVVVRYLWSDMGKGITDKFYSEEEIANLSRNSMPVIRLDWSRTEFEA